MLRSAGIGEVRQQREADAEPGRGGAEERQRRARRDRDPGRAEAAHAHQSRHHRDHQERERARRDVDRAGDLERARLPGSRSPAVPQPASIAPIASPVKYADSSSPNASGGPSVANARLPTYRISYDSAMNPVAAATRQAIRSLSRSPGPLVAASAARHPRRGHHREAQRDVDGRRCLHGAGRASRPISRSTATYAPAAPPTVLTK